MTQAIFCELSTVGLIAFSGPDATPFLQAQLTSDVAALAPWQTQYSGYCSPKGRLLATPLLWRLDSDILLQVPGSLREPVQSRLAKYVLRSKVTVADASPHYALFGVGGAEASVALAAAGWALPDAVHAVASTEGVHVAGLPVGRYSVLVAAERAPSVRANLEKHARREDERFWRRLDIEAGVPVITAPVQEEFVPQMVNLDLIGGVSYTKGCYPGQEIVARMHYLGRLKQRMYRVRVAISEALEPGAPLFSPAFGPEQACGAIVQSAQGDRQREALAVMRTASVEGGEVRVGSPDGPVLEFVPLPYSVSA